MVSLSKYITRTSRVTDDKILFITWQNSSKYSSLESTSSPSLLKFEKRCKLWMACNASESSLTNLGYQQASSPFGIWTDRCGFVKASQEDYLHHKLQVVHVTMTYPDHRLNKHSIINNRNNKLLDPICNALVKAGDFNFIVLR